MQRCRCEGFHLSLRRIIRIYSIMEMPQIDKLLVFDACSAYSQKNTKKIDRSETERSLPRSDHFNREEPPQSDHFNINM